jgi:hypothetical protein
MITAHDPGVRPRASSRTASDACRYTCSASARYSAAVRNQWTSRCRSAAFSAEGGSYVGVPGAGASPGTGAGAEEDGVTCGAQATDSIRSSGAAAFTGRFSGSVLLVQGPLR